jgi:hypothetical protein
MNFGPWAEVETRCAATDVPRLRSGQTVVRVGFAVSTPSFPLSRIADRYFLAKLNIKRRILGSRSGFSLSRHGLTERPITVRAEPVEALSFPSPRLRVSASPRLRVNYPGFGGRDRLTGSRGAAETRRIEGFFQPRRPSTPHFALSRLRVKPMTLGQPTNPSDSREDAKARKSCEWHGLHPTKSRTAVRESRNLPSIHQAGRRSEIPAFAGMTLASIPRNARDPDARTRHFVTLVERDQH